MPVIDERYSHQAERAGRRLSLRSRLALWIALSTTFTVVVFACVVYAFVRAEAGEEDSGGEGAAEQVLAAMAIAGPFCLALSVAGALVLSRRALAPIDAVVRRTSAMSSEDLHERLDVPQRNDELHDLVVALNALLQRVDDGFSALTRYAASASHELRTPLAVLTSELEVALRRPRNAGEWERTARVSLDELRRLSRLVESLLELARASGGSARTGARFELRERLDQGLSALAASVAAAGLRLQRPQDGEPVWLRGDAELFVNAVRELVKNAARYANKGGTVRVRIERAEGGCVAIHVDDEGPGIDAAERLAIFSPFFRGNRGLAKDAAGEGVCGLGLGLAIATRSVEACGGSLAVADSPEGGARFTILAPTLSAPCHGRPS
jgi:two-component system OmpR family sensor kinase